MLSSEKSQSNRSYQPKEVGSRSSNNPIAAKTISACVGIHEARYRETGINMNFVCNLLHDCQLPLNLSQRAFIILFFLFTRTK